jgi:hypothetical protein
MLENVKDVPFSIIQSLVWSLIDPTYDNLIIHMESRLAYSDERSVRILLDFMMMTFSCPHPSLSEKYSMNILNMIMNSMRLGSKLSVIYELDFWFILIYFGLSSNSNGVRNTLIFVCYGMDIYMFFFVRIGS